MDIAELDTTTPAWESIAGYLRARRAKLVEQCIALDATPEKRAEFSARIAEVDDMLSAPRMAQTRVAQNRAGMLTARKDY